VQGIAFLFVLPLVLTERAARVLFGRDVFFAAHAQLLSIAVGRFGSVLRVAYYNMTAHHCPTSVTIGFGSMFTHSEVEIGEGVYIGTRCLVGMANIGDHTMLADHVQLLSGGKQHGIEPGALYQEQRGTFQTIRIGRNCWLGTSAVVFSDVGDNSIIGAGSVVSKAIPANVTAAGVPARPLDRPLVRSETVSG